jgi:hypothetical protein
VAECPFSKHEALSSNPTTAKKIKKDRRHGSRSGKDDDGIRVGRLILDGRETTGVIDILTSMMREQN